MNRLHQFDKVEIVRIEHPDNSYLALEGMVDHIKELLRELKLPYRILRLCGGDLGFASALTYDFEVFSTAQDRWLEISSVSNFETFQANRLKLRYKDSEGKKPISAHSKRKFIGTSSCPSRNYRKLSNPRGNCYTRSTTSLHWI